MYKEANQGSWKVGFCHILKITWWLRSHLIYPVKEGLFYLGRFELGAKEPMLQNFCN
jgi:hypothetical protein